MARRAAIGRLHRYVNRAHIFRGTGNFSLRANIKILKGPFPIEMRRVARAAALI